MYSTLCHATFQSMKVPAPSDATEVYYDGACPLCRREIAAYRGMSGLEGIAWCDLSQAGADLPADLDRATALARFHVRLADGRIVSGARAFLAVWRRNPRLARLATILDRQPFLGVLELGYRGFLRIRPLWRRPGRKVALRKPDPR